jgi:tetratricopeptide (TPR) repeat protein
MRLKQALAKFNADPTNEAWANEAATEYEAALRLADARQVRARHETAIQERDQKREQALLARIKENPKDGQALGQLLEFLVEHKRVDDARAAYLAFLNADPTPKKHAVYGTWLSHNGFTEEAVTELTLALKGYDTPETRGYLGLALLDLGKKREAFPLIERAFKSNADIAQLRERYYSLAKELGTPVPEPQAP